MKRTLFVIVSCCLLLSGFAFAQDYGISYIDEPYESTPAPESMTTGTPPFPAVIENITDSLSDNVVGREAVHQIGFQLPESHYFPFGLLRGRQAVITFPPEFDVSTITSVSYRDTDDSSPDPRIIWVYIYSETVVVRFGESIPCPHKPNYAYITIRTMNNPTEARDFRVLVRVDNYFAQTVAGPNHSEYFSIIPDAPSQLSVLPQEPLTLMAGESATFNADVTDQYGNSIETSEINWGLDGQSDSIGHLTGSTLLATTVGVGRVEASLGDLTAYSLPITVTPGETAQISMVSTADTVYAGETLHHNIEVSLFDAYGNVKSDYSGYVWFTSDDSLAEITYDEDNPYQFTEQDQGRKLFSGDWFVFRKTGTRLLSVLTDDGLHSSVTNIYVVSEGLTEYTTSYPDTVIAGEPFSFSISGAGDSYGNLYTGELLAGGGKTAPDGTFPTIHNLFISNGYGSAEYSLFATGENVIELRVPGTENIRHVTIYVLPAEFADLTIDIDETQFVGYPFVGSPKVTAKDTYGNLKTDMADADMSFEFSVDAGEFSPISISSDQFDGATVSLESAVFTGLPGAHTLTISTNSENSESNQYQVEFIANGIIAVIKDGFHIPLQVPQGWKYGIIGALENNGNINPDHVEAEGGYTGNNMQIAPITPSDCIPVVGESTCRFQLEPETDIQPGEYQFQINTKAIYLYQGNEIPVVVTNIYETEILPFAPFIISDIDFPQLALAADYSITSHLTVGNSNDYGFNAHMSISVQASSEVSFKLESYSQPYTWESRLPIELQLHLRNDNPPGVYQYQVRLRVTARLSDQSAFLSYETPIALENSLEIIPRSTYAVDGASVTPASAGVGTSVQFSLPLNIAGQSAISIDGTKSTFVITDGAVSSGARFVEDEYTNADGQITLGTLPIVIPGSWEGKQLTGMMTLVGTEESILPIDTTVQFAMPLTIRPKPSIQVVGLEIDAPNTPYVNTNQTFTLTGRIFNNSSVDYNAPIVIAARSDGQSVISEPITIQRISAGDTAIVSFTVISAETANPAERFYLEAISGVDEPMAQISNDAIAVIQIPADVSFSAEITGRPGPVPILDFNEAIIISASYINVGQSSISGGSLLLNYDGEEDFGVEFPIEVPLTESMSWAVITPNVDFSSHFTVSWGEIPIDVNTGEPVTSVNGPIELPFIVEASITKLVIQADSFDTKPLERNVTSQLFELSLENVTTDNRNVIGLKTIMIEITDRDGNGIDGSYIVDEGGSSFYINGESQATLRFVNGKLAYRFTNLRIEGGQKVVLALKLTPKTGALLDFFNMRLDSDDISAEFVSGPRTGERVTVTGLLDRAFEINMPQAIIATDFAESFKNYPNPFNPEMEETEFIYNLPVNSDVDIYIYSVTGERVRHLHYAAGSLGGQSEQLSHAFWDGRNGDGDIVLNGVYIAYIEVAEGHLQAKLKMAVVK